LARPTLAHTLLFGLVGCALALAACSKGTGSSTPAPSASPTVTPSVGPSQTPVPSSVGIGFLPDAGNAGPAGITVLHFLTAGGTSFPYKPEFVNFASPVELLTIDVDATVGLAVMKSPEGTYSYLQGVLGISNSNIAPGGSFFDSYYPPPSPAPTNEVVPSISSEAMVGTSNNAVGLSVGPAAVGILGVNQASSQAPSFNGFVPFSDGCSGNVPPTFQRSAIAASSIVNGNGNYSVLVRGQHDLMSYRVTPNFNVSPPRYAFCYTADDETLGANLLANPGAVGRGMIAFSPVDSTRALLGQVGPSQDSLMLVTGLPAVITRTVPLALKGSPRVQSVTIAQNGTYAVIGTNLGLYVVSGINTGALIAVGQGASKTTGPYEPAYKGADGLYHQLKNVTSVGLISGGSFLAATASLTADAPGGGTTGTLVVLPFNEATGLLSAPSVAINNLPLNAFYQDILTVR